MKTPALVGRNTELGHIPRISTIYITRICGNNALEEGQPDCIFYDGFRPLIILQITNIIENFPWNNLISAANKAKARAKIKINTHLDQQYPTKKQLLKMSLYSQDDQAKNTMATFLQMKASLLTFD